MNYEKLKEMILLMEDNKLIINRKIIKKEVKKMIGISIAAKKEWEATLNYFGLIHEECEKYPFGEYFKKIIDNKEVVFF